MLPTKDGLPVYAGSRETEVEAFIVEEVDFNHTSRES